MPSPTDLDIISAFATKLALRIKYVLFIGCGPKRRCETVIAPDFFES